MLRATLEKMSTLRRQMSMPSSYHGSPLLYLWGRTFFFLRQALKKLRANEDRLDPDIAKLIVIYRKSISERHWSSTLLTAREIANIAERKRNAALMAEMSAALGRLGDYASSAQLSLAARHIQQGKRENEWNGEDISDRVLLIELLENSKQSLGRVIRFAQMIASSIPRAKRCIVLVESRLVPIFQRSFPGADIRADSENNEAARAEADIFASFPQLAFIFAKNGDEIGANFTPLKSDEDLTEKIRAEYLKQASGPLVGLSWGSKSYNKDVPSLTEWSQLIQRESAQFVSLQYGKVPVDLPRITGNNPGRMIYDPSIDQLKDMDRFAAQIGALDAVISISNTAAHFSGALNVPSIFVIDDKFHTSWPVMSEVAPWYPRGQVVLKGGREWPVVLQEVSAKLRLIFEDRG